MNWDRATGLDPAALEGIFHRAPFGVAFIDRAFRYLSVNETTGESGTGVSELTRPK